MSSRHVFGIGALAERTGTTPGVLRTWENRYGFPSGRRTASGHRRFSDADVRQVLEVLELREGGLPLQVAIETAVRRAESSATAGEAVESVHAALVDRFPGLRPLRLSRRALIAASYAIEDEALARADHPLVLGAFQQGHHFDRVRRRWDELARTASWSAVLADFAGDGGERSARDASGPVLCQLDERSPLLREWTVVTVSESRAAVLSAWEVPSADGSTTSSYESVISTRRPVATAAGRVLVSAAARSGADVPADVARLLGDPADRVGGESGEGDRMWLRALAHLDTTG